MTVQGPQQGVYEYRKYRASTECISLGEQTEPSYWFPLVSHWQRGGKWGGGLHAGSISHSHGFHCDLHRLGSRMGTEDKQSSKKISTKIQCTDKKHHTYNDPCSSTATPWGRMGAHFGGNPAGWLCVRMVPSCALCVPMFVPTYTGTTPPLLLAQGHDSYFQMGR